MDENEITALKRQINELTAELNSQKKYGLVWDKEKVPENVVLNCISKIPVLAYEPSRSVLKGQENNILIEGDNYHALLALNYVAKDSIDVVYIDPPYNTGNDFIYNDNYVDKEDGYRHSKWLSFMQKRLVLCRELMKENGLIFISIDDHEFAQLKLLCDSIFSENHFVACFNWMRTATAPNLSKTVRTKMEYVLCYSKGFLNYTLNGGLTAGGDVPLLNSGNKQAHCHFPKESVVFRIPDGFYPAGDYDKVKLDQDIHIKDGKALEDVYLFGRFKWSQETINEEIANGTYFIVKTTKFSIRFQRLNKSTKTPSNLLTKDECGVSTNEDGSSTLVEIFGRNPFSNPKPVSLIKYLVNMNPNTSSTILDFFAGSGTTGQAVLELNNEDGGNRRFILCTNNENNICDSVTYPRLKTVITGIRQDGSKYSEGIPANLYYFKTDFVNDSPNTDQAKYNLVSQLDPLLCVQESIFSPVNRTNYSSHYSTENGKRHLFIYNDYFNDQRMKRFKEDVAKAQGEKIVYIYSEDNEVDESLFEDIPDCDVRPIPEKIYEIYKQIVEEIKRGE